MRVLTEIEVQERVCVCVAFCFPSIWPSASGSLSWCEVKQSGEGSALVATFSCHSKYPRHTPATNMQSVAVRTMGAPLPVLTHSAPAN